MICFKEKNSQRDLINSITLLFCIMKCSLYVLIQVSAEKQHEIILGGSVSNIILWFPFATESGIPRRIMTLYNANMSTELTLRVLIRREAVQCPNPLPPSTLLCLYSSWNFSHFQKTFSDMLMSHNINVSYFKTHSVQLYRINMTNTFTPTYLEIAL